MSNLMKNALLQTRLPMIELKRFRAKINIQRPRQPHYERARVIAVTTPIYKEKPKDRHCFDDSHLTFKKKMENPYNDIIAKEALNWFNHSQMIAFFHLNSITADDHFKARVAFHKHNMHLKSYGKKITTKAVKGTKYEAILPLFESNHCIVFSPQQNVAQLLRIVKKIPQMILIGGIVEDTLMSKNEFTKFATMPSLQQAQAELVSTLNQACAIVSNDLEAHQKQLVNMLDAYAKSGESSRNTDGPSTSEASSSDGEKR
uniref:Large ribosomal subunit protein uL10m n=1 Tax=Tabanus bromius TaxID=304241 RepID=A0A0K8TRT9_TABBR